MLLDNFKNGTCSIVNVTLENDALIQQGKYKFDEGLYKISDEINGKPSWVKSNLSIWYIPSGNNWGIGPLDRRGDDYAHIHAKNSFNGLTDNRNVWKYYDKISR